MTDICLKLYFCGSELIKIKSYRPRVSNNFLDLIMRIDLAAGQKYMKTNVIVCDLSA